MLSNTYFYGEVDLRRAAYFEAALNMGVYSLLISCSFLDNFPAVIGPSAHSFCL